MQFSVEAHFLGDFVELSLGHQKVFGFAFHCRLLRRLDRYHHNTPW
jgi:hypothetical protein